jgi:hypothetical protein
VVRFSALAGGLDRLTLAGDPFFAFGNNLPGAIPDSIRLLVQVTQSFVGASPNISTNLLAGLGSQQYTRDHPDPDTNQKIRNAAEFIVPRHFHFLSYLFANLKIFSEFEDYS